VVKLPGYAPELCSVGNAREIVARGLIPSRIAEGIFVGDCGRGRLRPSFRPEVSSLPGKVLFSSNVDVDMVARLLGAKQTSPACTLARNELSSSAPN